MRSPAALLLTLGLIVPMAVAQDDSEAQPGSPSHAGRPTACDDAENGTCKPCSGPANASACHPDNATRKPRAATWHDCNANGETNCTKALTRGSREARWITFDAAGNGSLADYRVGAVTVLEQIQLVEGWGNLTTEQVGKLIRIGGSSGEILLHDDATGLVRFKGGNASLMLTFPASARIQASEEGMLARITYADGSIAHFRSGNSSWTDNAVRVQGFGSLALEGAATPKGGGSAPTVVASSERAVGAEISVAGSTSESPVILAYDDIDVQVQTPDTGAASNHEPIRISIASGLPEGRTIVVNLARQAIANASPDALQLRYFDVHIQKGGAVETELIFAAAAGLSDVLNPTDDGGQPEYWLVADVDGTQLLVSVPRWSEHIISIALAGAATRHPDVAIGIGLGIAGSVVAAIALLYPRRRGE